jgi:Ca-activated chloride channel family protein
MKFVHPSALWLLVLVPITFAILLWDEKKKQKRFETFVQRSLWPVIAPDLDPGARMRKMILWLSAAVFAILALARPQWGTQEEVAKMAGLDVMVVLDVSNSMETEDVVPSRLKKAKHFLRTLSERLEGDRLGLVTFAGGASVATPLTTDMEYFLEQLQIQTPRTIATQGTDVGLGLDTAARALDRGAAQTGQGREEIPSRAIVLISDGEDFEGTAREAAARLKTQGIRLYVFGVGTEKGGPVPVRDDSGSLLNYKRDRAGKPVVSTFHPDDLVQVASSGGGRYWNITVNESEITDLLKDLGALTRGEFSEHHYLVYKERFQYSLLIAVLLLLIEMSVSVRSRASRSNRVRAAGFLAVVSFLLGSQSAQATGLDTYQQNKKGIEAYKAGKIEEAQKEFGAAQARDPNLPELQYNQGLVHMQQGDTDAAIHDFQESARGAMKNNQNELLSKNFFNLGAAQAKKGDMKGALQSYLAAIGSAKKNNDEKMEQDARKNIELLVQQQKQQKQQQNQQQQQQQQQDQQQQQNQQQQQDQQKNQQQQQKQQQQQGSNSKEQPKEQKDQKDQQKEQDPKRYDSSTSRGKKFESQKLAPEDAERVLSELKNREKELQGRMKKQNGNYNSQSNDW